MDATTVAALAMLFAVGAALYSSVGHGGASAYIMSKVLEEQRGYEYIDVMPRTLTGKDNRAGVGQDADYFAKPSREDIVGAAYELMREAIQEMGGRIDRVVVNDANQREYLAQVVVSGSGDVKVIRARPGDANPQIGPAIREPKLVSEAGSKGIAVRKKEIMVAERILLDETGEKNRDPAGSGQIELRVVAIAPG